MVDFARQETPPVDCSSRNSYVGMDLNQRVSSAHQCGAGHASWSRALALTGPLCFQMSSGHGRATLAKGNGDSVYRCDLDLACSGLGVNLVLLVPVLGLSCLGLNPLASVREEGWRLTSVQLSVR